jgi:hypothetical protein
MAHFGISKRLVRPSFWVKSTMRPLTPPADSSSGPAISFTAWPFKSPATMSLSRGANLTVFVVLASKYYSYYSE